MNLSTNSFPERKGDEERDNYQRYEKAGYDSKLSAQHAPLDVSRCGSEIVCICLEKSGLLLNVIQTVRPLQHFLQVIRCKCLHLLQVFENFASFGLKLGSLCNEVCQHWLKRLTYLLLLCELKLRGSPALLKLLGGLRQ